MTDVVCGKEHCLLLTEHGQVWSWGGGSRGQLGHGVLAYEERPRLVSALDGMRIKKIAAGGMSLCHRSHSQMTRDVTLPQDIIIGLEGFKRV